jgi:hypothetical protein
MREYKGKTVAEILDHLDSKKKLIAERLRTLVRKTLPDTVETVKWGNITYLLNGKNLSWLLIYNDHVNFGFFNGSKLNSRLLEGTGKDLRHIKIRTESDIDEKEFSRLLKDAARFA